MVSHNHTNLPVKTIDRLLHPQSGDGLGQEAFLAPRADNQTCSCNRVLKPPFLPINTKVKGIEAQQDEMVSRIHTNLPVNGIV